MEAAQKQLTALNNFFLKLCTRLKPLCCFSCTNNSQLYTWIFYWALPEQEIKANRCLQATNTG